jgi:Fe-S cluster assembly protein SufD
VSGAASLLERLAPDGVADLRTERVRGWFEVHGLPTTRDEAWRYTALDQIVPLLDEARPPTEGSVPTGASIDELAGHHDGPRLVFVNGVVAADLCDLDSLPPGVSLGAGPDDPANEDPADGFAAINELAATVAATVRVEAGVRVDVPVHIVHVSAPGDAVTAVHPRTSVRIGRGSVVEIVETYTGLAGAAVTNASTGIVVDESSRLTYHRLQAEADDAVHVGATRIDQAAGSEVLVTSVMTGASAARSAVDVRLAGPGAHVDLRGLYLPTGVQRHDDVVRVEHAAPHCRSTQLFKGVVDDHGRGSFTGHVVVRHGAIGTSADQTNRNLVLRPTAQADTRPWLEILADDVRCAHGATVGRLDDDALFYLRSRGIPLAASRALLIEAFVGEVVDGVTTASVRERVAAMVRSRIPGTER